MEGCTYRYRMVVVANDVDVAQRGFAAMPKRRALVFLGRIDEPRKGLSVLLDAMPAILRQRPDRKSVV